MIRPVRNMIQTIIILFVIAIIFQQCTTVNLNAPFKKKEYDSYPFLKDGVESENYVIEPLLDGYPPSVTYHPSQNYFIIDGGSDYKKLNNKGKQIALISRVEDMELAKFTHFVFSKSGVYNLSEDDMVEVAFKEVLNLDRSMEELDWKTLFDSYYGKAEIVIYGQELSTQEGSGFPIYFKVDDYWIKVLTKKHFTRAYDDSEAMKHVYEGYPAKFERMVVLKDPSKKTFSNREKEEYLLVEKDKDYYELTYSNRRKIKLKYYDKQMIDEHIPYTSIPSSLTGTGFYHLKMGNEVLKFKETALKVFFRPVQNHFDWYILPDAYFDKSEVSFLEFSYPHNFNESGSNGLYIIKPK